MKLDSVICLSKKKKAVLFISWAGEKRNTGQGSSLSNTISNKLFHGGCITLFCLFTAKVIGSFLVSIYQFYFVFLC